MGPDADASAASSELARCCVYLVAVVVVLCFVDTGAVSGHLGYVELLDSIAEAGTGLDPMCVVRAGARVWLPEGEVSCCSCWFLRLQAGDVGLNRKYLLYGC